jgi:hypothetical protein
MNTKELPGNIKAILSEYKKAIDELITVISSVNDTVLAQVIDQKTEDPDCKSIQTILSHVVCSGYGYTIYIENANGTNKPRREKVRWEHAVQYIEQLNLMYQYCEDFFTAHPDIPLEEFDNSKKISVNWGQQYDVEQLMEHAIVHILRHRRQIENFIRKEKELR